MKPAQMIIAVAVAALFAFGCLTFVQQTRSSQVAATPPADAAAQPPSDSAAPAPGSFGVVYEGASGYDRAYKEYNEAKAPAAIYFYTDWCGYCKQFDRELLASSAVREYFRNVVKVKVNPEDGAAARKVADEYGVHSYPSFFIFPQGTSRPVKVARHKRVGNEWVLMTPEEFVRACQEAAGQKS